MIARRHVAINSLGRYEIYNPYEYDLRARAAVIHLGIEAGAKFYRQFEWHRSLQGLNGIKRAFTSPDVSTGT